MVGGRGVGSVGAGGSPVISRYFVRLSHVFIIENPITNDKSNIE